MRAASSDRIGRQPMYRSVLFKLFFTFLGASLLIVAGMYSFMRSALNEGFSEYIETLQHERVTNLLNDLADYYSLYGNWNNLAGNKQEWIELLKKSSPETQPTWMKYALEAPGNTWPPNLTEQQTERTFTPFGLRAMLLDANKKIVIGRADLLEKLSLRPVISNNRVVGYLGLLPGKAVRYLSELTFIEKQVDSYFWITLFMIGISACVAMLLAYLLERQLGRVTSAAQALAAGQYTFRLTVESNDELGQLARDINDLAAALERSEQSRRRWVADISHELRTPLSVLRGELEALQDGIRPLTTDAVDSLLGDVMRLNLLTEDLYQLSLADQGALSYRKSLTDPVALLEKDLARLRGEFDQKKIGVSWHNTLPAPLQIHADPYRLSQLFRNLLKNSASYTNRQGRLEIHISRQADWLLLDFADSEPGVPAAELPRLFDRFYRVDSSRNRNRGGAGLGMAICSNIVEAHNGRITALPSTLNGLCIHIELPITP